MTAGRRLLVTGGSGMVGRAIRARAAADGFEVLAPGHAELDLCDADATRRWLADARPDVVVHAAGKVGGIQANIAAPVDFLVQNLDMGRNVVLAARAAGVERLLNLGSSCMYPRAASNPLDESMVLTGELEPTNEGYAIAKIATARLCQYVSREDPALRYRTLLPCNLYGPHDKFDPARSHLVAAAIHKLHQAKVTGRRAVTIWGDGTARREFMYVGDLADAVAAALPRFDDLPDLMNVGVGRDHTILDYYQAAARAVGFDGAFEFDLTKPVGMRQKVVSVARLRAFGWSAATSLDEGLARTYAYYLENVAR